MITPAPAAKWTWWIVFFALTAAMLSAGDTAPAWLNSAPIVWSMWFFMGVVILFARHAYPPRASHWLWMLAVVGGITLIGQNTNQLYDWSGDELAMPDTPPSRSSPLSVAFRLALAGSAGMVIAQHLNRQSASLDKSGTN